jgi:thymidylate kinase
VTALAAAYQPGRDQRKGLFIVLEGISGSGKSTLAALLARQLKGRWFHTVPAPVSDLQPYVNASARPLPQLAFYLAGALHASDLARASLRHGHVVADRYINSVIANHAAVHGLGNDTVTTAIAPFTRYLLVPDMTVYLHTSPTGLARRMSAKNDQTRSDRDLLADPGLLQRLQDHYDQVAATDPTARHLQTTGRTPDELAGLILGMLPATTGAR